MHGQVMCRQLGVLSSHFNELAVPSDGRYVRRPDLADESGVISVPPPVFPPVAVLLALGAGPTVGALTTGMRR